MRYAVFGSDGAYRRNVDGGTLALGDDENAVVDPPVEIGAGWAFRDGAFVPPGSSVGPDRCSKLGLKRAFEELGMWSQIRAFIDADEDLKEDWSLAIEIRREDPIVDKAVAALAAAGVILTGEDVQRLIARAVDLVA